MAKPSVGRIVLYRSKTGTYTVPAIVSCTERSLNPAGVDAGAIPALSGEDHVHLTVLTPGSPGKRIPGVEIPEALAPHGVAPAMGGSYNEWDIRPSLDEDGEIARRTEDATNAAFEPGTWAWPARG